MSETAFKVSAILKDFMQAEKAENLTSLFEKLASEAAGKDYLNQKDKIDLITRIDSVNTNLITRIDSVNTDLITRIDNVKTDLITRIDSVKTDINNNLWKVVAVLVTVMGICSAAIIHYR